MPNFVDPTPPGQCLFCKLVAGEIPAVKVHEDDAVLAFMDRGPVNPGHVLVATKRHAVTLLDITDEEGAAVMRAVRRIAQALTDEYACPGLTVLQANGREGHQTVFHFHVHLVPRHADDGADLVWPRRETPVPELQEQARRIAQRLQREGGSA